MATDVPVTIRLRADGRGLTGTLNVTRRELRQLQQQTERSGREFGRFNRRTTSARERLSGFAIAARAAVTALAVREVAQMADEMTRLDARLRLVTDGQAAFNRAQQDVSDIANQNGQALDAVGELYVRLSQSSRELRDDQDALETITRAVTQSMRVSGASATESAGAIRQLSQSFAAGVLRGDEFNSVNEQAPRLMQALADSLGITRGELRGLAEQGALTSDILREAFIDQAGEIAAEAAQIPQTMGEAVTVLQNQLLEFVAAIDQATGGSGSVTSFINRISDAVGTAADLIQEHMLEIQLGVIAAEQVIRTALNGIQIAFDFMRAVVTEALTQINDLIAKSAQITADLAAGYLKLQRLGSGFVDLIPGIDGTSEKLDNMIERLEKMSDQAEDSIISSRTLIEVLEDVGNAAVKRQRDIAAAASADVDAAIAADALRRANEDVAESSEEAGEAARKAAQDATTFGEALENIVGFAMAAGLQAQSTANSFAGVRAELIDQIVQARGAGEALEEYNRQQFQAAAVARAGVDPTSEMAEALRELAGAAFDAERGLQGASNQASIFGDIGSGFAQSIFQGQSVRDSISSALIGTAGQDIADGLGESLDEAFDSVLENLEDPERWRGAAEGFMLAAGQAIEGNLGQAAFTAAGTAIGAAFGGQAGAQIGATIGSLLGDLFFGDSVPKFQARGTRARTATDAGTDQVLGTPFGDFELAFRGLDDSQRSAVVEAYTSFFNFVGDLTANLATDQQQRIADAVQEFGISSRSGPDSPEDQLKLLLSDIAATFPPFFGRLIDAEATLDAQLAKFADLLSLKDIVDTGRGLGGLGFEQLAVFLDEAALAGESLTDALERIRTGFETLTRLGELTGNALRDSTEGLAQLSADLTQLFGGDAGAVASRFQRIFDVFFSEEQNLEATIATAGAAGENLLRELLAGIDGIDFSAEFLTRSGFADLLTQLTSMDLSAEQLAILAEAGVNIADLIEAEEALAEARGEGAEAARDAAAISEILAGLETNAVRAGLEGLELALFDLGQRQDDVIERLREAGATAEEIARAEALFADERERITAEYHRRAIEQERRAADARREAQERAFEQQNDFMRTVGLSALRTIAPARAEYAQLANRIREAREQAMTLHDAEAALNLQRRATEIQTQAFIQSLRQSIPETLDELLGDGGATAIDSVGSAIADTTAAAGDFRDQWLGVVEQINGALDAQVLGTSTLTAPERLAEAEQQFFDALRAAEGGDLGAAQNLTRLFDQAIGEGAGFFGTTTDDFAELEARLRGALENADLPIPPESPERATAANTARTADAAEATQMSAFEQVQLATTLIDQIGLLAQLTGRQPSEIGAEFGVPIARLIEILTGEQVDLTGGALDNFFNQLVADTNESLNELAQLEITAAGQLTALNAIEQIARDQLNLWRQFQAGGKFGQRTGPVDPGFGKGGQGVTGAAGPSGAIATPSVLPEPVFAEPIDRLQDGLVTELRALRERIRVLEDVLTTGNRQRAEHIAVTDNDGDATRDLLAQLRTELRRLQQQGAQKPALARA